MTLPWITVKICYIQQLCIHLDSFMCWNGNKPSFSGSVIVTACDQHELCLSLSCENAFSLFYLTVKNCSLYRFTVVTYSSSKFMFESHWRVYILHWSWQPVERHNTNTCKECFIYFPFLTFYYFLLFLFFRLQFYLYWILEGHIDGLFSILGQELLHN